MGWVWGSSAQTFGLGRSLLRGSLVAKGLHPWQGCPNRQALRGQKAPQAAGLLGAGNLQGARLPGAGGGRGGAGGAPQINLLGPALQWKGTAELPVSLLTKDSSFRHPKTCFCRLQSVAACHANVRVNAQGSCFLPAIPTSKARSVFLGAILRRVTLWLAH